MGAMNKREFRDLVNYIKNRPEEARELMQALTQKSTFYFHEIGEKEAERGSIGQWLTASEVGKEIGRSRQWVKDHDDVLPVGSKRQSQTGRRTRMYLWNNVTAYLLKRQL